MPIIDHNPPNFTRPGEKLIQYVRVGALRNDTDLCQFADLSNADLKMATIGEWWEKHCLIFTDSGGRRIEFRRRDLLLTLANKEGGAHVDTMLPADYERFVLNRPMKLKKDGVETDSIQLARFAAVEAAAQMIDCLDRNGL